MTTRHLNSQMRDFHSLVDLLQHRAQTQTHQYLYTFLQDGDQGVEHLTYSELDQRARAIGVQLQQLGAQGERVLLLYPPGLEYIAAFFGCLYAGAIAIPAYPPNPARLERTLPRLNAIVEDARPRIALTTSAILHVAEVLAHQAEGFHHVQWQATDTFLSEPAQAWRPPQSDEQSLAFLQYTSGSTATPKGVMLSHGNLLANSALIYHCFGHSPESRGVIWLPPYHDMGLIGGILQPLYGGFPVTLMSPVTFLQRPLHWLQAISETRATSSGGPNFAYDLCVRKIKPEERATLDLSSWELAFNGAEPIRADTLDRFAAAFAVSGFRREAFYPCYGLAEATLIVLGGDKHTAPVIANFQSAALAQHQAIHEEGTDETQTLVGSGHRALDQQVVIANIDTHKQCESGQVGEIWVSGPSVAQGYWDRTEATQQTFEAYLSDSGKGPFLRTGDLGFLDNDELFVTGRIKDLIIIRGRNYYPQDLELTAEQSHPALRPGSGAAFSVEIGGEEQLVIVYEVERQHRKVDIEEVAQLVRQTISQEYELAVYAFVLLKPGGIPKTSSGKIQRHACKQGFLTEDLPLWGSSITQRHGTTEKALELSRETLLATDEEARLPLLETYLQSHIAQMLRVPSTHINSSQAINACGLDSLMAVELQHQVETDLGLVLSMTTFLSDKSVHDLAHVMLAQITHADAQVIKPVRHYLGDVHFLSPSQQALWFLYRLAPESAAYNISNALRIHGTLDIAALEETFQQLINRHPALRTTILTENGIPSQYIHPQSKVFFNVCEASDWNDTTMHEHLVAEAHRPFDLEKGPLFRVSLFKRSSQEHVLLVSVHHIVADLWSLSILMEELHTLYPATVRGSAASLKPPSLYYTDYVHWKVEMLASPVGERIWSYWHSQLADAPPVLNLPIDYARPPVQTYHGAVLPFAIDPALSQRLKIFADQQHVTLYMVLLTAFQVLLYRYSNQHDFVVGTPTARRNRAELARVVGYFVNSLALRTKLEGSPSFIEALERTRQTVLGAFEHQEYPFVRLVERLQPPRDLSRSPLFQVMFALQKTHLLDEAGLTAFALGEEGARIEVGGLSFESITLEQRISQFDLSLAMGETGGRIIGSLEYNTDLFERTTAQRMMTHLQRLLEMLTEHPNVAVGTFSFLSATEHHQLLVDWNDTQAEYPQTTCVHTLFETQARQTPEAVAVICQDQRLTYSELVARTNQLALYLQSLGVGPETCVCICLERSLDVIASALGVLKAGGTYIPIDPGYPEERIAFILEQTKTPVLLTHTQLQHQLPATRAQVVCLDADWDSQIDSVQAYQPPATPAGSAACVIYTSGSTGQPKGVVLSHNSIVNLITSFLRSFEPDETDRILPLTSVAYASFVGEIFPLLCAGGALVLPTDVESLDFEALYAMMRRHQVTMLSTVPSMITRLNERSDMLPRLRLILSGGEALSFNQINRLINSTTLSNGYGLTETTVCSTTYYVHAENTYVNQYIPVGQPVINTQAYVLDKYLHCTPIGSPGDLYISGDGLARGYLGDPSLTAKTFIPNPFILGQRMYRTGDLARWLSNGMIDFLGRVDQQVKVRGYRVDLGEIETQIRQHGDVGEAAVVAHRDNPQEVQLVAYVVPTAEYQPPNGQSWQSVFVRDVRGYLKGKLPDYMLPAMILPLESLPLTHNGKVDVKALPRPKQERPDLETSYLAPQNEVERTIADIWQKILQVEKVGIHDNFFDLGGHSLLLVQVHDQLRQSYGQLSLIDLFRHPTIRSLAVHLNPDQAEETSFEALSDRANKQKAFHERRKRALRVR